MTRVGFVVPRYGDGIAGGAEVAAKLLAEHLAAVDGFDCEVFTTTALDAATWRNEVPAGTTSEHGVSVHRFASQSGRGANFAALDARVLGGASALTVDESWRWLEQLGPVCPDAVDAAVDSACGVVTLGPYMYHPIVTAVSRLGRRAVLHPATHDEPAIHLPIYEPVFTGAGALAWWSEPERRVAARLFPSTVTHPQLVVGIGVDPVPAVAATPAMQACSDRPFVLCLGRVLAAKGSQALAVGFAAYKQRFPGPLALVFAGEPHDPIPPHPDIVELGMVDTATKHALLTNATALVSPSPNESLALVVLEAWSAATPVIVNGAAPVTRDHCVRSGGGLWFDDYATFEAAITRITTDAALAQCLGRAGQAYVAGQYSWPVVIERYVSFLERICERL
ncbi:MAG TPA: glycosyltransferase family 4 protein [Acidimicrobiia bacterium]|jgi:glycosyltransferase involved in cell wall biosynthesis